MQGGSALESTQEVAEFLTEPFHVREKDAVPEDQPRTDGTAGAKKETGTSHSSGDGNNPHEGQIVEAATQKMGAQLGQKDKGKAPQYRVDRHSVNEANEASGSSQVGKQISNAKSENDQNASPREEGKERARDDVDSIGRENVKGTYINPQEDMIPKVQIEPDRKGWARLADMYYKYDEDKIRDAKEDIDTLLVFAGLFSAVLSAFVIETYSKLSEDSDDTNTQILMQISAQLASLSITSSLINSTAPRFSLAPFSAPRSFVRINTLWSCSLTISLITASIGILVKQWFHEFMAQDTQNPQHRIRIRFFRSEGLDRWQVFQIAAALPLLLQVALLLFFIGLSEYLRELNPIVGWATTGTILAWLAVFVFTTLAPILSSQCPYRTPILKAPLRYTRSTTQYVYGFIKQYLIGSIWISTTSLLVPGKRILLSHIHPLHKTFHEGWTSFVKLANGLLHSSLERAMGWLKSFGGWLMDDDVGKRLLKFFATAPISLPLLLVVVILEAKPGQLNTPHWKWPDTSHWQWIPPSEESTARDDETNDREILIYSGPFFLDQQLNQTIRECIKPITASQIVSEFAVDRQASITSSRWKVNLRLDTKRGAHDMVREIVIHMAASEPKDISWFAAIELILKAGKDGPYWGDLPTLIIRLTRSDLEHGATAAFLAVYSLSAQSAELIHDFCELFEGFRSQGDQQYLENVAKVTRFICAAFWNLPISTLSSNEYLQSIIKERDLKADSAAFCAAFSGLFFLASLGAVEAFKGDIEMPLAVIWGGDIETQILSRWMEEPWFISLTYLSIERGVQTCFVTIYSLCEQVVLWGIVMFAQSARVYGRTRSLQYIRNLLEMATNMSNAFWNPPSPSTPTNDHLQAIITERKLKPDITSFLQTFSALYRLASKEATDACRGDVAKFVDKIWEMRVPTTADSLLPTDKGTFKLVHLCMEIGGQSPFLALYSSASKESFNHQAGCDNSPFDVGSVQYLDNLLSIANSVINLFWSPDPSNPPPADKHLQGLVAKHSIKQDVGAFFYTFSILLKVASLEAIRERKEEVRGVTSSMLRILEEDTELVVNATRTARRQIYWAWRVLDEMAKYHCKRSGG